jgi:hypothetical protein
MNVLCGFGLVLGGCFLSFQLMVTNYSQLQGSMQILFRFVSEF